MITDPHTAVVNPTISGSLPPVVEIIGLKKYYRQGQEQIHAVDDVNLRIASGDFLLVTGRSGSGKTTLLSLIGGLTAPTTGEVLINGQNLAKMEDGELSSLRAREIGFVFQFASMIPTLTALDNVRLPGLFSGKACNIQEAKELLTLVGLEERGEHYPAQLSGGQQTRVAVARALVNHPLLLLADEPTGSLDHQSEHEIMELLAQINQVKGITIILVTHNTELAKYANRHIVMDNGKVVEEVLSS
jgi:ABC-type lipoprotein export system ATPase subunit